MARTKQKDSKKGSKPSFARVSGEKDRRGGNKNFIRLNDDEKFVGYALFAADPEMDVKDNPAYLEYSEHWDNQMNRFVPCWGPKNGCIYCKAGQNPSNRAMVAFLVTEENGEKLAEPTVKTMRLNWSVLSEFLDEQQEEDGTLGKLVRIKCESRGDGEFRVKIYEKKPLTKKQIAEALKDVPDLGAQIQRNLDQALDALRVQDVLDEDDDDDDDDDEVETTPKNNKKESKNKKKDEDEDDDEDEEDEDEDEDDDEDDDSDDDDSDDDEDDDDEDDDEDDEDDEEDDDEDSDDDEEESDDDDEEDEDEEEDSDDTITGEYNIKSVNESENTFTLTKLDSDLYLDEDLAGSLDWSNFKKGDKVVISAEKDEDDDWVATSIEKLGKEKPKAKPKPKGGKKK